MLTGGEDGSSSSSNSVQNDGRTCAERLECKLSRILLPLIEEEVSSRLHPMVAEETARLREELCHVKGLYGELSKKYAALQVEMQRSRISFEKKCQEWRTLKETLSQRDRLKSLLTSLEPLSISSNEEAKPCTQSNDAPLQDAEKSVPDQSFGSQESRPGESDPLDFLAEAMSSIENRTLTRHTPDEDTKERRNRGWDGDGGEDVDVDKGEKRHSRPLTPLKRPGPQCIEPMRTKSERKQAHAKDCSCCSKVILLYRRVLIIISG